MTEDLVTMQPGELAIRDLFYMKRSDIPQPCMKRSNSALDELFEKFELIWNYDNNGEWFIALMFYMRNARGDIQTKSAPHDNPYCCILPPGRGEKLISYNMLLWLLKYHPEKFLNNYYLFINRFGYFKDCLNLATMAKERRYPIKDVNLLLSPMALALIEDERIIIQNKMKSPNERERISLASKWAPREGKAFSHLIPHLKMLCNITGAKSNVKWRKYIQQIVRWANPTIEKLLSTKQYSKINFDIIPRKAQQLYKNTFIHNERLNERYTDFVLQKMMKYDYEKDMFPHEVLNDYINQLYFCDPDNLRIKQVYIDTEETWESLIDTALNFSVVSDIDEHTYIPILDLNSMLNRDELKVGLTMTLLMSYLNSGPFHKKIITHTPNPSITKLRGITAFEQINHILSEYSQPYNLENEVTNEDAPPSIYIKVYENLLVFFVSKWFSGVKN